MSRAPFFAFCVLLVALLQNVQTRSERALHHKLDTIADGLADLIARIAARTDDEALRQDIGELREAVGLEQRETYDRPEGIGRSGSSSLRACRPPFEINRSARRPR